MSFDWRPRHAAHAIEVMALSVNFTEPLPQRASQRAQDLVALAARDIGQFNRSPLQGIRIVNGTPAQMSNGLVLDFIATPEQLKDNVPISAQVEVGPMALVYRTWAYQTWPAELRKVQALLAGTLNELLSVMGLQSVRLEYQNRFVFEGGSPQQSVLSQLLRSDSPLIAPHVFKQSEIWHSHTGRLVASNAQGRRVEQLHIEAVDLPFPPAPGVTIQRWITLLAALETRFDVPEAQPPATTPELFSLVETLHTDVERLLLSAITPEAANAVGLGSK